MERRVGRLLQEKKSREFWISGWKLNVKHASAV